MNKLYKAWCCKNCAHVVDISGVGFNFACDIDNDCTDHRRKGMDSQEWAEWYRDHRVDAFDMCYGYEGRIE